jgi:hypothetical protein
LLVTLAFTIAALLAAILNGIFLGLSIRRSKALLLLGFDGPLSKIALAFVRTWGVILASDLLMVAAGSGLLTSHRLLGYLLVVVPMSHVVAAIFALRGFA